MLGSLILCLKGMRLMMFQLSGFYCRISASPTLPFKIMEQELVGRGNFGDLSPGYGFWVRGF